LPDYLPKLVKNKLQM